MTIDDVRKNIGKLVRLNGRGDISQQLTVLVAKKTKLMIVKLSRGSAILEIPGKKDAGFIQINPVGIDLAPLYDLNRS